MSQHYQDSEYFSPLPLDIKRQSPQPPIEAHRLKVEKFLASLRKKLEQINPLNDPNGELADKISRQNFRKIIESVLYDTALHERLMQECPLR